MWRYPRRYLFLKDCIASIGCGRFPPFIFSHGGDWLETVLEVLLLLVEASGPALHIFCDLQKITQPDGCREKIFTHAEKADYFESHPNTVATTSYNIGPPLKKAPRGSRINCLPSLPAPLERNGPPVIVLKDVCSCYPCKPLPCRVAVFWHLCHHSWTSPYSCNCSPVAQFKHTRMTTFQRRAALEQNLKNFSRYDDWGKQQLGVSFSRQKKEYYKQHGEKMALTCCAVFVLCFSFFSFPSLPLPPPEQLPSLWPSDACSEAGT